jgi:hypothetical protein
MLIDWMRREVLTTNRTAFIHRRRAHGQPQNVPVPGRG